MVPLAPPRRGPDRLARLLAWAARAGLDVDLIPIETLWGPADHSPSLWNLPFGNPYDPPEWARWLYVKRRGQVRVILGAPGTRTALEDEVSLPEFLTLFDNYPNPFRTTTTLRYALSEPTTLRLVIYDMLGRKLRTLVEGDAASGTSQVKWDGRNDSGQPVPQGIYFYRLETPSLSKSGKMVLVK